jgi:hypothetical protein
MPNQRWLIRGDARLLAVHHRPAEPVPAGAAVLWAGFSHPMCDADYFMSKLARQLAAGGLFVAQVDPRGHGDSPGDFADVDLDTLRDDIALVLDHYQACFPEGLLCIGRGLAAPLLAEVSAGRGLAGVAGVAPYCLPAGAVHATSGGAPSDAAELFPGRDYTAHTDFAEPAICLLNALGAVPYNLHGMRVSARLLEGLAGFDAPAALRRVPPAQGLWLIQDERDPAAPVALPLDQLPQLAAYRQPLLPRNPAFHRTAISRLVEWAMDRCALA